jgi:hypothetical protein
MRNHCLALGLGTLALGVAGLAQAATITIGTSINGGAITTRAAGSSPGPVDFAGFVDAQWNINSVSAINPNPNEFDSNSINTSSGGGTEVLTVYITESDILAVPGTQDFLSGLTANLVPANWSAELATYINPDNAVFGTEHLLSSHTFSAIGGQDLTSAFGITTSPVSLTEVYTITPNNVAGTNNATIDLSTSTPAIPEPATWGMVLLGFAGLGFAAFRKGKREVEVGLAA